MLAALCPCAFALNPSLDISQYAHKAWTIREGFFKGVQFDRSDSRWLPVARDGVRAAALRRHPVAVPWAPPGPRGLPGQLVIQAVRRARRDVCGSARAPGLPVGTTAKLTRYPEFDGSNVVALLEDRGGELWVGVPGYRRARLALRDTGRPNAVLWRGRLFGIGVVSLYEDSTGNLWAGERSGLWRCKPGPPKRYATSATEIRSMPSGRRWKTADRHEWRRPATSSAGSSSPIRLHGRIGPYRSCSAIATAASGSHRSARG